jgi:hypothetical protein
MLIRLGLFPIPPFLWPRASAFGAAAKIRYRLVTCESRFCIASPESIRDIPRRVGSPRRPPALGDHKSRPYDAACESGTKLAFPDPSRPSVRALFVNFPSIQGCASQFGAFGFPACFVVLASVALPEPKPSITDIGYLSRLDFGKKAYRMTSPLCQRKPLR